MIINTSLSPTFNFQPLKRYAGKWGHRSTVLLSTGKDLSFWYQKLATNVCVCACTYIYTPLRTGKLCRDFQILLSTYPEEFLELRTSLFHQIQTVRSTILETKTKQTPKHLKLRVKILDSDPAILLLRISHIEKFVSVQNDIWSGLFAGALSVKARD